MSLASVGAKVTTKVAQQTTKKAVQKTSTASVTKTATNASTGSTITRSSLTSSTKANSNSGSVSSTTSNSLTRSATNNTTTAKTTTNPLQQAVKDSDNVANKKALLNGTAETEPNMKNIISTEKTQKINTQNSAIVNNTNTPVKNVTPVTQKNTTNVSGINNEKVLNNLADESNAGKISNFGTKVEKSALDDAAVATSKSKGLAIAGLTTGALVGTALAAPTILSAFQQTDTSSGGDLLTGGDEGDIAFINRDKTNLGDENSILGGNQDANGALASDALVDNSTGDLDKYLNPDGNIDSTLFVPGASGAGSDGYIGGGTVYAQSDGYEDDSSYSSGDNSGIPAMIRDWVDNAVETIQENPVPTAIIAAIVIIIIASLAKNKKKGNKGAVKTALPMKAKAGGKKA